MMKYPAAQFRPGDEFTISEVEYFVDRNQSATTKFGDPVSMIDTLTDDGASKTFFFPLRHKLEGVVY